MTLDATPPPVSTMRRDLISAYLASGMKVASWTIVMAMVFRYGRLDYFALFVLVRSTIGILNYTTLGLAPAMISILARTAGQSAALAKPAEPALTPAPVLPYAEPSTTAEPEGIDQPASDVMKTAIVLSFLLAFAAAVIVFIYGMSFTHIHRLQKMPVGEFAGALCVAIGFGVAIRLFSDSFGAILQSRNRIAEDNLALAVAELVWISGSFLSSSAGKLHVLTAGTWFFWASVLLLILRGGLVIGTVGFDFFRRGVESSTIRWQLLSFGLLIGLGQLADFLYAPTDYILIRHLLDFREISTYAPAVQIDAGLLLLVGGLASVLLPKSAHAHAAGDMRTIRQYYVRGTLAGAGLLAIAGVATYALSPWIFKLWLGDPLPATQIILPLILIHTVVGGSSAVGRSILLGMGKVKPFTIAVLVAGMSNVVLSYVFVRYAGLGLKGIVLGTICAVVGRCAIWQPWCVWRSLKDASKAA